jgi:hypothetical protein
MLSRGFVLSCFHTRSCSYARPVRQGPRAPAATLGFCAGAGHPGGGRGVRLGCHGVDERHGALASLAVPADGTDAAGGHRLDERQARRLRLHRRKAKTCARVSAALSSSFHVPLGLRNSSSSSADRLRSRRRPICSVPPDEPGLPAFHAMPATTNTTSGHCHAHHPEAGKSVSTNASILAFAARLGRLVPYACSPVRRPKERAGVRQMRVRRPPEPDETAVI